MAQWPTSYPEHRIDMSTTRFLQIDRNRSQPIYQQIAEQIRVQIGEGRLPAGTQLPTVRQLAEQLDVTRVTIQNAYGELQADGWIESTVGRGTFVTASASNMDLLNAVTRSVTADSVMGNIHALSKIAGMRSFAYAKPDPAFFPKEDFWASLNSYANVLTDLMEYGPAQGDEALRIEIAAMLNDQQIAVLPDDIVVTNGVTQGLALATHSLAPAGSTVAVEQPVYLGMLHVVSAYQVQPVGVPLDAEGVRLDALEQVVREHQPRFLYTVTNFQNPTGRSYSAERRQALLTFAEQYKLPIVEDDTYGLLAYDGEPPLSLKAQDRHDWVIYLNGFSKVLMPGLRIGFMAAPPRFRDRIVSLRQAMDLSSSPMLQRVLAHFLHRGRLKVHLRRVLPHYKERRDAAIRALAAAMPEDATWTLPEGGFCCWVTLPRRARYENIYQDALEHGVAVTPGDVFLTEPDDAIHFRLCFSSLTTESIREGIAILGQLLHERRSIPTPPRPILNGLPLV